MRKRLIDGILGAAALAALSAGARADMARRYQFVGTVARITPDVVEVEGEGEPVAGRRTLQFRNGALKLPSGLVPGDHVTLWYQLEAVRIRKEQPGGVSPEDDPAKKGIIRDDRAFYDAKNEARPGFGADESQSAGS